MGWIRAKLESWKATKLRLKETNRIAYFFVDITEVILVAFVMAMFIRTFFVQTSYVFSGSMIPTMQIGDRLVVDKVTFHFRKPHRGEIVLFKSPYKDGKEFVKRLVGLGGETVELRKGVVYINGKEQNFPGIDVQRDYSYFGPEKIPTGSYFMLGDNRSNSADSRIWGFVPQGDLIGRGLFNFWPINRIQVLH